MRKKEVDYYEEIAKEIVKQFQVNLNNNNYEIKPLIGEISSGLRTLIANNYNAGTLLKEFAQSVHRLHLDISVVIENKINGKFEIIIFEIKKVESLGLKELSQLIGYCLVSKSKFGILINIDKRVSREFSIILNSNKDLTNIKRTLDDGELIEHKLGVMIWNSTTLKFEYTNTGAIKALPMLIELTEKFLK